ncbi:hypothetical protein [Enterococcus sp. AZ192]|uniref:hypothetical protein n=1 Tax=unclassified Enterococcus TaxID=2608891 RepID=UPI003D29C446
MSAEIVYRTEDMKKGEYQNYYIDSEQERKIIENLKSKSPILLNGSRGNGKTLLMRVAEKELDDKFSIDRILPIFVSFKESRLVNSEYFTYWMMSKILFALRRKLKSHGFSDKSVISNYYDREISNENESTIKKIEEFQKELEKITKTDNKRLELLAQEVTEELNLFDDIEYFHGLIEDLSIDNEIDRMVFFFDEACHNFMPEQQRQFFSFFRDLRSPYISCKAAVYPGLSYFGTFQAFHDAEVIDINRDVLDSYYVTNMRKIVEKQIPSQLYSNLVKQGELFNSLIFSCSGNPRLLLKSLSKATENFSKMLNRKTVNEVIKDFYRSDIWTEHTKISNLYPTLAKHIDWGRLFIEEVVISDTLQKNNSWMSKEDTARSTCYFCIHKDAPAAVKKAIKILEYSGIVYLHTEATRVRSNIYDRYALNIGILVANNPSPYEEVIKIMNILTPKLYTDYSMNSPKYGDISEVVENVLSDTMQDEIINNILQQPIDKLDITRYQRRILKENGIDIIKQILEKEESGLKEFRNIGNVRSRQIWSSAYNAFFEYISG